MGFLGMPDHHADYYAIDEENEPPILHSKEDSSSKNIGCIVFGIAIIVGLIVGLLIYLYNR